MTREEIERLAQIAAQESLRIHELQWDNAPTSFKGYWMKVVRSIVENMQPNGDQESPKSKLEFSFTHTSGMHVQVLSDGKILIDFPKETDE